MGYREKIPPDLLKKFDENKWESVESNLKLGLYREKNKKYATLYVDHYKAKRDASLSDRREAREDESLSISRSAFRISKKHLKIAIIAIVIAIVIAILEKLIVFPPWAWEGIGAG